MSEIGGDSLSVAGLEMRRVVVQPCTQGGLGLLEMKSERRKE